MPDKLINGDYKKDETTHKALTVEYVEALLQDLAAVLNTKRGRFYPNKNYGSYIRERIDYPAEEYAFAYASQAVGEIDGVTVKSAAVSDGEVTVSLIVNNEEKEVRISLENNI